MTKQKTTLKKPSISQLCSLLDKPALLGWANKIGLEGTTLADYRKKSTGDGISIHKEVQNYISNGTPFANPEHEANFLRFMDENKIEDIHALEKSIETQWFTGRYDIFLTANGKKYMCDFKSSDGIYFEQVLQLSGYRMAEPCDAIAVIQVPEFFFKPIDVISFELYEEIIKSLNSIFISRQSLKLQGMIG